MNRCRTWLMAAALSLAALAAQAAEPSPLATIDALDVGRYMGTWHEIAKYPNWFQKKCVAAASADYRLQKDGTIQVINRCRLADGTLNEAIGTARQIGPATSPRLQVRFAPAWLSFIPAVWGDYWVIDIDPGYQWVVVSEPRREYLWILARTPELAPALLDDLRQRLAQRGFDLQRLETNPPQR